MLGEEDLKAKPAVVVEEPEPEPKDTTAVIGADDLTLKKVGEALSVDNYERDSAEIKAIIEYVSRQFGAKELNDIIWEVRRLKNELGTGYNDQPLKRLYRYVYLQNEKSSIDNELRRFDGK